MPRPQSSFDICPRRRTKLDGLLELGSRALRTLPLAVASAGFWERKFSGRGDGRYGSHKVMAGKKLNRAGVRLVEGTEAARKAAATSKAAAASRAEVPAEAPDEGSAS